MIDQAFPAAKPERGPRYFALRLVSFLLRLIGWIWLALGTIGILVAVAGPQLGIQMGTGLVSSPIIIFAVSFAAMSWGIFVLAAGQLLQVFANIARNTASLPNIAEHTNWFYKRMNTRTQ
jgi:hypothetical protein